MPILPNVGAPGYLLVSTGSGQNNSRWIPLTDAKDYSVSGTLAVPSGATGYLPPFICANNGQLLSVSGMVRSGSLTLDIQQNGSAITGLTSLAIGTTPTLYTPTDITLVSNGASTGTNGDYLQPVIDTVSSADGLTLSFVFWIYL